MDSKNKYIFDGFLLGFLRLAGSAERPKSLKKTTVFNDFCLLAYDKTDLNKLSKRVEKPLKNH